MKVKIIIFMFLLSSIGVSQTPDPNSCFNQLPYTKTTDPTDNTPYVMTTGSFNYNVNPNAVGAPTHYDWVTTITLPVYTTMGLTSPDHPIRSPFYCLGNQPVNGGCVDNNLRIYNDISSNFTNYANNLERLKAMDVLPEDGWELLKYSFGRAIDPMIPGDNGTGILSPYIWLYNRYTGKSKFFIAVTSLQGSFNTVNSASIKFTVNGDYDVMANAQPFTHILSDFDHVNGTNALANCDIQQIGSGLPFTYYWLYAEFTTSYDPCVCRQAKPNAQLEFFVTKTSVSTLELTQEGTITPIPVYNANGLNSDGKSNISTSGIDQTSGTYYINGAKAVIKGYKDWEEYAKTYKAYFNQITNNGSSPPANNPQALNIITTYAQSIGQGGASQSMQTQIFYDFVNGVNTSGQNPSGPGDPKATSKFIQKLAGLSPLVEDLASAAPYIGAFIALTNFLTDAGSNDSQTQPLTQPAAPPTSYALNSTIKGQITQTSNVVNGGIYLPGVKNNNDFINVKNEDYPYPIYNNALGVFNVIDVPNFEYKSIPMTNNGVDMSDPNYGYGYLAKTTFSTPAQDLTQPPTNTRNPFDGAYDYKLSGPVKYALNPTSNLTVKSIDACYIIEYNGDDALALKHDNISYFDPLANNNNGGFSGYMRGNSIHNKQIPYYPSSGFDFTEYVPYTEAININYSLSSILDKFQNQGFEIEYKSINFNDPLGNNGANSNNEKLRLRTKYVPVQSLQSIDFILLGDASQKPKIYLKLFCKFIKNNKPNDEPVTMVLTYDISTQLSNAYNAGSGGYGNYNYYYMKDKGNPYDDTKPGDYAHFGNLYIYGAYYTANYGTQGPVNIGNFTTGATSAGDVNISNGSFLIPTSASGFLTYSGVSNINIGNDVNIASNSSQQQIINVRAGNDINIGKGFFTYSTSTNSPITYNAGNNINISDGFYLGNYSSAKNLTMYSGNKISINNGSTYFNTNIGTTGGVIYDTKLYAKNEIDLTVAQTANAVYIGGESVLSSTNNIPNIYAILHNDDGSTPLTTFAASNSDIANVCNLATINNRQDATGIQTTPTLLDMMEVKQLKDAESEYNKQNSKVGIFPNPTTGDLNVNFFLPSATSIEIILLDVTGKPLLKRDIRVEQGYSSRQINLQEYTNGIYILKIVTSEGALIKTEKIVLNR